MDMIEFFMLQELRKRHSTSSLHVLPNTFIISFQARLLPLHIYIHAFHIIASLIPTRLTDQNFDEFGDKKPRRCT
jgi:hypothetical protein